LNIWLLLAAAEQGTMSAAAAEQGERNPVQLAY
jgi:hypothetical protein